MRVVDIIIKKRDKYELSKEEIEYFIQGYSSGEIPDYQASAWAMAVLLNGMTPRETTDLTLAMAHSGEILDLTQVVKVAVDKHSTGGVGDKTTLVVEPAVAACGLPVGKMSGHGLGFSGGTLDKMESIPGFRTDLSTEEFIEQLRSIGLVLTGQSADLAPADGKLYALRDVTGTVQSIPLIASSVMSKKIAAGAQAIVLDVKVGKGAFMDNLSEARVLAERMVSIAGLVGRKAVALLSDMNQPLGYAVGNALELKEAIATLTSTIDVEASKPAGYVMPCDPPSPAEMAVGPDFCEHCLTVAGHLLALGGVAEDENRGRKMAMEALNSGRAWEYFRKLVQAQGGDVSYIDHPERLPRARLVETVSAPCDGYLSDIDARLIGEACVKLGAGRATKEDTIDHAVGVVVHHKVGDRVALGEPLFTLHANDEDRLAEARQSILSAHVFSDAPVLPLPLFYGVVKE